MHRSYCPQINSDKTILISDPNEVHHIKNVLRLKKGAPLQLFDGKNGEGEGRISIINNTECRVSIDSWSTLSSKTNMYLVLACAIPKKSKFETIIEKATELSVNEIIPMHTQRTQVHLKGERLIKKKLRFETVALNAAKQCQRCDLPMIHSVTPFKNVIDLLSKDATLIMPGLTKKRKRLLDMLPVKQSKIVILIGPEGDFTAQEYDYARKNKALIVSLGEHVLKVETAALATVSTIQLYYS